MRITHLNHDSFLPILVLLFFCIVFLIILPTLLAASSIGSDFELLKYDKKTEYLEFIKDNSKDPFCEQMIIVFELKEEAFVQLDILTPLGNRIKQLVAKQLSKGLYTFVWDTTNEKNVKVENGVYEYKIKINNFEMTHTLPLLK